jgi:hypothetical protein
MKFILYSILIILVIGFIWWLILKILDKVIYWFDDNSDGFEYSTEYDEPNDKKTTKSKITTKSETTSNNKEQVDVQLQKKGGMWGTIHTTSNNSDSSINNAMNQVQRTTSSGVTNNGRVRAIGRKTKSIYDIR